MGKPDSASEGLCPGGERAVASSRALSRRAESDRALSNSSFQGNQSCNLHSCGANVLFRTEPERLGHRNGCGKPPFVAQVRRGQANSGDRSASYWSRCRICP